MPASLVARVLSPLYRARVDPDRGPGPAVSSGLAMMPTALAA